VKVLDLMQTPEHIYIVLEFCNGGDLAKYLRIHEGKLTEKEVSKILLQLNQGLQILSEKKIIHRDLKPENILIHHKNNDHTEIEVKIADFGISRKITSSIQAHTICGTPAYMAPEVLLRYFQIHISFSLI
jgi:serine/threonine-protein kinase ULK2